MVYQTPWKSKRLLPVLAAALDGVEGFLHPDDEVLLHDLAAVVPAGQFIVEIGAYRGRSTIALATGAPEGVLVYSIDPHHEHEAGGYPFGAADNQAFMHNIAAAGLGAKVRVLNMPSNAAITAQRHHLRLPIGLLFVDGGHEFEQVRADVFRWMGFVSRDGIVAIHNSTGAWADPTRVADELKTFDGWVEMQGAGYTRVFKSVPKFDGVKS